jgi:5'(3')-deoxyribonucleotidase
VKIAIDCDGVLADFDNSVRALGTHYPQAPLEVIFGGADNMWAAIEEAGDEFHTNLKTLPRARLSLESLRHSGHEIVCVTAPPKSCRNWEQRRTRWLQTEMGFARHEIIFATEKSHVCADMLVDDWVRNFENWKGHAVLVDKPWSGSGPFYGHRVFSIADVLALPMLFQVNKRRVDCYRRSP